MGKSIKHGNIHQHGKSRHNPKSQKSLWLAKKDCVNAVVEEGDSLDYSIDETTGICDLTIYFDGNARNLEVMISRVSSK